ncbi:hypothetical protein [Clostridium tagluense]|uniref:Uncharacterized protein n=1 Tax=Clostridium tagluense TaxID=360422 RepID=A0A401ULN0_9CLOT|nr:hypothetical protein [Clostridium tagluense]GCD10435.1 hypothetical protein Ctaglu_20580 [Clostridium tagluense]
MANELVKLCMDTYKGNVDKYSVNQGSDVIRKAFVDICGTDKLDFKTFRKHKTEVFEILEEVVDQLIVDGWGQNTFFDQFVETKDLAFGDKNEFYVEDKSLLLVSKFSGGHWNLKRQRMAEGNSFSVTTSWYGVKIYENFMRFLAGKVDWSAFINKIADSITNQVKQETYTAFMGATAYLPSQFKGSGTFEKDTFLEKCEHVSASCGNAPVLIAGTKTALGKLTGGVDTSWISEKMKDERNVNGIVQSWEGYKVLVIEQVHKANTFDFAIDAKKLLILPANVKPVKMVNEGESLINEVSDGTRNMDGSMEYMFQKKMGTSVIFNVMYGSWDLA